MGSTEAAERLEHKYAAMRCVHEDFRDISLIRHGFMFLLVMRDTIISCILTLMVSQPLAQIIVMLCCSVAICLVMLLTNPFRDSFDWASQLFSELCVLVVYICVLCLAISDVGDDISSDDYFNSADSNRYNLAHAVIVINTILLVQCLCVAALKTIIMIWRAWKEHRQRANQRIAVAQAGVPGQGSDSLVGVSTLNQSVDNSRHRQNASVIESSHSQVPLYDQSKSHKIEGRGRSTPKIKRSSKSGSRWQNQHSFSGIESTRSQVSLYNSSESPEIETRGQSTLRNRKSDRTVSRLGLSQPGQPALPAHASSNNRIHSKRSEASNNRTVNPSAEPHSTVPQQHRLHISAAQPPQQFKSRNRMHMPNSMMN